jgi:nucleoid-associated protein YgaU
MGLYEFIRNAGKALGIGGDEAPTAEALKKELDSHNIGSDRMTVEVKGDRAIIKGEAASQEALEKAIVAVGNTVGISKVETNVTAPAAKEPRFYTVKKGDTLWEIAEEVYGKGKGAKNKAIFEANRPMLKSANKIYPGQVLRIPEV